MLLDRRAADLQSRESQGPEEGRHGDTESRRAFLKGAVAGAGAAANAQKRQMATSMRRARASRRSQRGTAALHLCDVTRHFPIQGPGPINVHPNGGFVYLCNRSTARE